MVHIGDKGIIGIIREFLFGIKVELPVPPCPNCEMLQEQLAFANYDRKMLLEHFVRASMPKEESTPRIEVDELQPIRLGAKQAMPWRVKQQQLEENSRQRASQLKPTPRPDAPREISRESIEKLEQELGVDNGIRETVQGNP